MPIKRPIGRNNLDKALHRLFKGAIMTDNHATMVNVFPSLNEY